MQRENHNPATNDVTQNAKDGTELPIVIPTPLAPQTSVTIAAEVEEKSAQEAFVPQPVTFYFSSQPATALQQRQPEAVEEERKYRFDVLPQAHREIFRAALLPNGEGLFFRGDEFSTSDDFNSPLPISSIQIFFEHNLDVTYLNAGESVITDADFAALVKIPSLKSLEVAVVNSITDTGVKALNGNTTIESLTLSRAYLTNAGLEDIAAMQRLKSLELDRCMDAIDLSILAKIPKLTFLRLHCNSIQIASFPRLESLELLDVALTDTDFAALQNNSNNPQLKCLTLKLCTGITDNAKTAVLQKMQEREVDSKAALTFLMAMKKATKDKEALKKPKSANLLYDSTQPAVEDLLLEDPLYDPNLLKLIAEATLPCLKTSFKNSFL